MKLAEFFNYLKPTEVISIVSDFGLIVEPTQYHKMSYVGVSDILDAEVIQVYYDPEDNSLTIDIAFEEEEDD